MSTLFVSPYFHRENFNQQTLRLAAEFKQAQVDHTLSMCRAVLKRLEDRRDFRGISYSKVDLEVEAHIQCQLEGINPLHINAAVTMISSSYFNRSEG